MEATINEPKGQKVYEWIGAIAGLVGSYVLATHGHYADWGFFFYLFSNACFIVFAVRGHHTGLLVMQVGFTFTSLLGIHKGFDGIVTILPFL